MPCPQQVQSSVGCRLKTHKRLQETKRETTRMHPWFRDPKSAFYMDIHTFLGFIIGGFIWDIPILIFAYVLLGGPSGV